jgi:hypothetical protein
MTATVTSVKCSPSKHPISNHGAVVPNTKADLHHSSTSSPRHERSENHKPNLPGEEEEHYVLTLRTDATHSKAMTTLRAKWFPAQLLKVDAHVTLFHALPGSKLREVKQDIATLAATATAFKLKTSKEGVYEMGKGAGIRLSDLGHDHGQKKAARIRAELRAKWAPFLSQQDKQERWRGHYTIMNKENNKERVSKCLWDLKDGQGDSRGTAEGLNLWRYDYGRWREVETFHFQQ